MAGGIDFSVDLQQYSLGSKKLKKKGSLKVVDIRLMMISALKVNYFW